MFFFTCKLHVHGRVIVRSHGLNPGTCQGYRIRGDTIRCSGRLTMFYNLQSVSLFGAAIPVLVSVVTYITYLTVLDWSKGHIVCQEDFGTGKTKCRPSCQHGYFSLPGMDRCLKWLNCDDIDTEITRGEIIGQGAVKLVQKGLWRGHEVAINTLHNVQFKEDILHGLSMIRAFQPRDHVIQLIGSCEVTLTYITQFYPLGSANTLESALQLNPIQQHNLLFRFKICISYVKSVHFLHTSPMGKRVMCDSNDPYKSLSQFLISPNLDLVLNDLDALPEVVSERGLTVKCGHRELGGDFVAPEQLWPFDDIDFDDSLMPGYDEKSDIWKIPDVCNVILGTRGVSLRLHLFEIHAKCKEEDPSLRPTAEEVLTVYTNILHKLDKV